MAKKKVTEKPNDGVKPKKAVKPKKVVKEIEKVEAIIEPIVIVETPQVEPVKRKDSFIVRLWNKLMSL